MKNTEGNFRYKIMPALGFGMRPICDVDGCSNEVTNVGYDKNGYVMWRKYKWVSDEYGGEGFLCNKCHKKSMEDRHGLPINEIVAKNKGFQSYSEYETHLAKEAGFENATDHRNSKHPYLKHRKSYCENVDGRFGFKCPCNDLIQSGTLPVQDRRYLHVDHNDGNPSNNDPENLVTLCVFCHNIKTSLFEDWKSPGRKALNITH